MEHTAALHITDTPQITVISFVSQLGGALNLWARITVVVIIEIIELCYEVLAERIYRRSREEQTPDSNQEETQYWLLIDIGGWCGLFLEGSLLLT